MLKPMEMIQVLIHWQFRNGVWKVLPCSVQLRSLVIPLVNLYLCGFFCLCRYKKKKKGKKRLADSDLNWNYFFLYFFSLLVILGFSFLPLVLSLFSRLLGDSSLGTLAVPAEHCSPSMYLALLCVSWAVFSHVFLSFLWNGFKNLGPPSCKGVCFYQLMSHRWHAQ